MGTLETDYVSVNTSSVLLARSMHYAVQDEIPRYLNSTVNDGAGGEFGRKLFRRSSSQLTADCSIPSYFI